MQVSFAAHITSRTPTFHQVQLRPTTSWLMEVGALLFLKEVGSILLGGWSGDGITLPGALDIECKYAVGYVVSLYHKLSTHWFVR